jgi:hypothetical protein
VRVKGCGGVGVGSLQALMALYLLTANVGEWLPVLAAGVLLGLLIYWSLRLTVHTWRR